jgi:hypothetical protein
MNTVSLVLFIFTAIWTFGGIIMFSWLKWDTLVRKAKSSKEKTIAAAINAREWCKINAAGFGLLAPFLIPTVVTLLCLFFG